MGNARDPSLSLIFMALRVKNCLNIFEDGLHRITFLKNTWGKGNLLVVWNLF